jgi:hypothetical protein
MQTSPLPPGLRLDGIAILDNSGRLIVPIIPESIIWVESPMRILINASETVALLISVGATPGVELSSDSDTEP